MADDMIVPTQVAQSSDLVTRLRQWSLVTFTRPALYNLPTDLAEAADEIERLRAEVARLGAFLHPIGEQARRG